MPKAKGDVIAVVHPVLDFVEFVFPRPAIGYRGGFEHCVSSLLLFFSSLSERRLRRSMRRKPIARDRRGRRRPAAWSRACIGSGGAKTVKCAINRHDDNR